MTSDDYDMNLNRQCPVCDVDEVRGPSVMHEGEQVQCQGCGALLAAVAGAREMALEIQDDG